MSALPRRAASRSKSQPTWDWTRLTRLVTVEVASPNSRRMYSAAIRDFRAWSECSPRRSFTRETVERYRAHLASRGLSASSINLRLTVIRKLAEHAASAGLITNEDALGIERLKGTSQLRGQSGEWLTVEQAQILLQAPMNRETGDDLRMRRDAAIMALLLGCGLRRSEVADIRMNQIVERDGRPDVSALRDRTEHRAAATRAKSASTCSARPAPDVCEISPLRPGSARADTIVARARLDFDDRALPGRETESHRRALRPAGDRTRDLMRAARHMIARLKSHIAGDDREFLSVPILSEAYRSPFSGIIAPIRDVMP